MPENSGRVKLLGHVGRRDDGYEAWVAPALVPPSHPLAGVRDSYNAVMVEGNACGTLMFYGRGAGGLDRQCSHGRRHGSHSRRTPAWALIY